MEISKTVSTKETVQNGSIFARSHSRCFSFKKKRNTSDV